MKIVGHHEHYHKDKAWIELLHDGDTAQLIADDLEILLIRRVDHRTSGGTEIDGYPKEKLYGLVGVGIPVGTEIPWDTTPDEVPGSSVTLENHEQSGADNNISILIIQSAMMTDAGNFTGTDPVSTIPPQKFEINYDPYKPVSIAGTDWTPYIIGAIILVVIAALVYWYFLRGRTVFGHRFGPAPKAPAQPPASAPAAVAPPASAPAPAPAPEVKP
jgi:hypothetical protein